MLLLKNANKKIKRDIEVQDADFVKAGLEDLTNYVESL